MFQKEVAERIVARQNSGAYGRLSVAAQWRSNARIAMNVNRSAFVPPPKVTSAVVHIVPADEPEVGEALLAALLARAGASGAPAVAGLVPPWSPWFAWFQERGFLAHPTDYRTAAVTFERAFDAPWLARNWWYQLADTDLV